MTEREATVEKTRCKGLRGLGNTMPTVLRWKGYRFYFYSHEPNEPPHVHVDRGSASAKFWLQSAALARNFGFAPHELRELRQTVTERQDQFMEAWNGHFGGSRR